MRKNTIQCDKCKREEPRNWDGKWKEINIDQVIFDVCKNCSEGLLKWLGNKEL